jgi:hypothetical protein
MCDLAADYTARRIQAASSFPYTAGSSISNAAPQPVQRALRHGTQHLQRRGHLARHHPAAIV